MIYTIDVSKMTPSEAKKYLRKMIRKVKGEPEPEQKTKWGFIIIGIFMLLLSLFILIGSIYCIVIGKPTAIGFGVGGGLAIFGGITSIKLGLNKE